MSWVSAKDVDEPWWPRVDGKALMNCLLCSEQVALGGGHEAIFWAGAGSGVLLHPSCAVELGVRLIVDASQRHRFRFKAHPKS